jgi:hypothetical protein
MVRRSIVRREKIAGIHVEPTSPERLADNAAGFHENDAV